jgi:hypothetical protein
MASLENFFLEAPRFSAFFSVLLVARARVFFDGRFDPVGAGIGRVAGWDG